MVALLWCLIGTWWGSGSSMGQIGVPGHAPGGQGGFVEFRFKVAVLGSIGGQGPGQSLSMPSSHFGTTHYCIDGSTTATPVAVRCCGLQWWWWLLLLLLLFGLGVMQRGWDRYLQGLIVIPQLFLEIRHPGRRWCFNGCLRIILHCVVLWQRLLLLLQVAVVALVLHGGCNNGRGLSS